VCVSGNIAKEIDPSIIHEGSELSIWIIWILFIIGHDHGASFLCQTKEMVHGSPVNPIEHPDGHGTEGEAVYGGMVLDWSVM
jgi:hypothetical protein